MEKTPQELKQPKLTAQQRIDLITRAYKHFVDNTETFGDDGEIGRPLGETLAYLWPAIAGGWTVDVRPQDAITHLLKDYPFPELAPFLSEQDD